MSATSTPADSSFSYKGIFLFCSAIFFFAVMDTIVKYANETYPPVQVVWARYFFHTVLMAAILLPKHGTRLIRTKALKMQLIRSIFLLLATVSFFTAVKYVPLADAAALGATAPLFVIIFSVILLKEKVNVRRWVAVAIGFGGAMIVLRPGMLEIHPALFLVIGTSIFYSLYQISTRFLSGIDDPVTTITYSALVGTVVMSAVVPFFWVMPDLHGWLILGVIGFIGGFSHFIIIKAFDYTAASTVAPFQYTQLIWMAVFGYFVFGNFPDNFTILGAVIIVASGLYILYRENQIKKA
ncbi:EamA family transporter [Sneathiella chungangensis]|uniref:EamA family transporter n=1 Tax=Sneathiella chungangensis TaxID=1418234 RepID=A0A845M654_9PROT|nr:DMT family transporter [Sneathiella chungangensis]MZR20803.1 EamA family transporter [Sneathiella chungangensis]